VLQQHQGTSCRDSAADVAEADRCCGVGDVPAQPDVGQVVGLHAVEEFDADERREARSKKSIEAESTVEPEGCRQDDPDAPSARCKIVPR